MTDRPVQRYLDFSSVRPLFQTRQMSANFDGGYIARADELYGVVVLEVTGPACRFTGAYPSLHHAKTEAAVWIRDTKQAKAEGRT